MTMKANKRQTSRVIAAAGLVGLACGAGNALAQPAFRTILLSGTQPPGVPSGVLLSNTIDGATMNGTGKVSVVANLVGTGINTSNQQGVWTDVSGTLTLLARTGSPAPGIAGANFSSLNNASLSDNGSAIFVGLAGPPGGPNLEVMHTLTTQASGGSVELVARQTTQVPGLPTNTFWSGLGGPLINNAGAVLFRAILNGSAVTGTSNNIHMLGQPQSLGVSARNGQATSVIAGVSIDALFNDFRFNSAGQVAFRSGLVGTGVTSSNNAAVWFRDSSGAFSLVQRLGSSVPGFDAGITATSINGPSIGSDGSVVYNVGVAGPGITSSNNFMGMLWKNGVTTRLLRTGDAAPALGNNVVIQSVQLPVLGGQGTIVVRGTVSGPGITTSNNKVLYIKRGEGPWQLVLRAGDPAPFVSDFLISDPFNSARVSLNREGQALLQVDITRPNIANSRAHYLVQPDNQLQLIVREGVPFDVNDDPNVTVLKTIQNVQAIAESGDDEGRPSSLSDAGDAVFVLRFTDSTRAVVVASLPSACDSIDFNGDGLFPDESDLVDFLSVLAGGACTTNTCNDIDFNNDGLFPDDSDLIAFLQVLAGGGC
jgi:hypothetical protein